MPRPVPSRPTSGGQWIDDPVEDSFDWSLLGVGGPGDEGLSPLPPADRSTVSPAPDTASDRGPAPDGVAATGGTPIPEADTAPATSPTPTDTDFSSLVVEAPWNTWIDSEVSLDQWELEHPGPNPNWGRGGDELVRDMTLPVDWDTGFWRAFREEFDL